MIIKHHKGFDYKNPLEYASPLLHKEMPKMVPCTDKHDRVGKNRLKQIHKRVKYLAEEGGYNEREKPTYKIHQLCSDSTNKIKYHDRSLVDVSPQTQGMYIRCSGLPWLCRAKNKLIVSRRMIFNPYRLMKIKCTVGCWKTWSMETVQRCHIPCDKLPYECNQLTAPHADSYTDSRVYGVHQLQTSPAER